jgi:hypothetical protein
MVGRAEGEETLTSLRQPEGNQRLNRPLHLGGNPALPLGEAGTSR